MKSGGSNLPLTLGLFWSGWSYNIMHQIVGAGLDPRGRRTGLCPQIERQTLKVKGREHANPQEFHGAAHALGRLVEPPHVVDWGPSVSK